jgi:hypothetical protein
MVISNSSQETWIEIFWGFILLSFKHILLHAQGEVICIQEGNTKERTGAIVYGHTSNSFLCSFYLGCHIMSILITNVV